jgi:hypothetical protein
VFKPGISPSSEQNTEDSRRQVEIELDKAITRLARDRVERAFNEEEFKRQIASALSEFVRLADGELTPDDLEILLERYLIARNAERSRAMLNEIALEGQRSAKLGVAPNKEAFAQSLAAIRESYADVSGVSEEAMLISFAQAHDTEYQRKLSTCGWCARQYYGITCAASSASNWLGSNFPNCRDALKGLANLYLDYQHFKGRVFREVGSYILAVAKEPSVLTEDISAIANVIWGGGCKLAEGCKNILASGYEIGLGAVKSCLGYISDKGAQFIGAVQRCDFSEAWGVVKELYQDGKVIGAKCLDGLVAGVKLAFSGAFAVVRFLWSEFGLDELCSGFYHSGIAHHKLGEDLLLAICGRGTFTEAFSNYKDNITKGFSGCIGFAKAIWRQTGIPDICSAVSCFGAALAEYGRGNKYGALLKLGEGALHAIVGVAAVVCFYTGAAGLSRVCARALGAVLSNSGGVFTKIAIGSLRHTFLEKTSKVIGVRSLEVLEGAALNQIKKGATAEVLEGLAKEAGERGVPECQVALQRLMTKCSEDIAEDGCKELSSAIIKEGEAKALSLSNVDDTLCRASDGRSRELLRSLGLGDYIEETAYEIFEKVKNGKQKDAIKFVTETFGLHSDSSKRIVSQMKTVVGNPNWDKAVIDILEDGISKELHPKLAAMMESPFKGRFKSLLVSEPGKDLLDDGSRQWLKRLREGVQSESKRLGKDLDSYADELVESGWAGTKKGLKQGIKAVVREGLEGAFKRLRGPKIRPKAAMDLGSGGDDGSAQLAVMGGREGLTDDNNFGLDLQSKKRSEEQQTSRRQVDVVYREIELADGTKVNLVEYLLNGKLIDSIENFTIADSRKRGPRGSKGALDEEPKSQPKVALSKPAGVKQERPPHRNSGDNPAYKSVA